MRRKFVNSGTSAVTQSTTSFIRCRPTSKITHLTLLAKAENTTPKNTETLEHPLPPPDPSRLDGVCVRRSFTATARAGGREGCCSLSQPCLLQEGRRQPKPNQSQVLFFPLHAPPARSNEKQHCTTKPTKRKRSCTPPYTHLILPVSPYNENE